MGTVHSTLDGDFIEVGTTLGTLYGICMQFSSQWLYTVPLWWLYMVFLEMIEHSALPMRLALERQQI